MRPETAVRKQDRGLRVFQQGVVTRLQPRACENVVYAFERGVGALVCSLLLKLKLANIEPFWSPAAALAWLAFDKPKDKTSKAVADALTSVFFIFLHAPFEYWPCVLQTRALDYANDESTMARVCLPAT